MAGAISIKRILFFTAGVVIPARASCPYNAGNEGLKARSPEHRLEPRYHTDENFGRCPRKRLSKYAGGGSRSWDWWPCELSLEVLRQNGKESNPLGADFIYANEFAKLDCKCILSLQTNAYTNKYSCSVDEGHNRVADYFSKLVAGRFRQLRRILDPTFLA